MKLLFIVTMLLHISTYAELIDGIVAVVNEEIITQSDLKLYKKKLSNNSLSEDLFKVDIQKALKDPKILIDHIIDVKITESEVKKEGISVSMDQVEATIEQIRNYQHAGISKEAFKSKLKKNSISFAEYQNFIKKRIELQELVRKAITSKIRISDDDLKAYYVQNFNGSKNTYQNKISHIVFIPKDGEINAALERANIVFKKLNTGESFETLASKFSEEPNFSDGGLLGSFKTGELNPKMESVISKLQQGEFSKPVNMGDRIHIFKVISKSLVESPDFIAKKQMITEKLYEIALKKQFRFWLSQKRQQAFIKIN